MYSGYLILIASCVYPKLGVREQGKLQNYQPFGKGKIQEKGGRRDQFSTQIKALTAGFAVFSFRFEPRSQSVKLHLIIFHVLSLFLPHTLRLNVSDSL